MSDKNLLGKAASIVEGHVNEVLNRNAELFDRRIKICLDCEKYTVRRTAKFVGPWCSSNKGGCGCRLNAKLRVENEKCPDDKW